MAVTELREPELGRVAKQLIIALVIGAVMLLGASGHGHARSARAAFLDSDGDGVPDQTETLFGSDPHDASSTPESGGVVSSLILPGSNRCSDGIDNDRDGLIDSADPDCQDSDVDGFSDPVEQALGSNPLDGASIPENTRFDNMLAASIFPEQLCNDGEDDDEDGLIDTADPGCSPIDSDGDGFDDVTEKSLGSDWLDPNSVPEHATINPGSCTDGIDNDHDGLIDVADPGCVTLTNDNVADATIVSSLPFDAAAKSLGATTEPGEPAPDCALDAIEGTVWYSFTASSDTPVIIDTSGSDFATVVGVWTANQFGYSQVTCNNSFFFNPSMRFAFQAAPGVTYKIQVGRNSRLYPGAGAVNVHMEAGVIPPNDNFADAAETSTVPSSATVDNVAATVEGHEPAPSCSFGSRVHSTGSVLNTIWFRYAPTNDTYVRAELSDSTSVGSLLAVYRGSALDALTQVACSGQTGVSTGPDLAFLAEAGQSYHIQVGLDGYFDNGLAGKQDSAASPTPTGSAQPALNLTTFDVPSCPAPQFTIADSVGDQFFDASPDILSIAGAFTASQFCFTATFNSPVDPSRLGATVSLDTDGNRQTNGATFSCNEPSGIGLDVEADAQANEGVLMRVAQRSRNDSEQLAPGTAIFAPTSVTIVLPLSDLGDDSLRFALMLMADGAIADCAPDGGSVSCTSGTCSFSPFRNGDANCNGAADPIDAAIVLQAGAGLGASVACPDAADVNGDGRTDSLDAVLILQYSAGLLDQLPPAAPPPGPPF